jgi:hypothetical protein
MEGTLGPLEWLRVALKDREHLSVRLLQHANRFCQALHPVREA